MIVTDSQRKAVLHSISTYLFLVGKDCSTTFLTLLHVSGGVPQLPFGIASWALVLGHISGVSLGLLQRKSSY